MYCSKCGKEIEKDAKFCKNCGIQINEAQSCFVSYNGDFYNALIDLNYSDDIIKKLMRNPAYGELEKTLSKDEVIYFASEMFLPNSSIYLDYNRKCTECKTDGIR